MLYLDFDCTITTVGSLLDGGASLNVCRNLKNQLTVPDTPTYSITDSRMLEEVAFGGSARIAAIKRLLTPEPSDRAVPGVTILSRSPTALVLLGLESVGIRFDPAYTFGFEKWEDEVPEDAPKWVWVEQHDAAAPRSADPARPLLLVDDDVAEAAEFKSRVRSCAFQHVDGGNGLTVHEIDALVQRQQEGGTDE